MEIDALITCKSPLRSHLRYSPTENNKLGRKGELGRFYFKYLLISDFNSSSADEKLILFLIISPVLFTRA